MDQEFCFPPIQEHSQDDEEYPVLSGQTRTLSTPHAKVPAVRGARACTACRQAKMKCAGGDDSTGQPCQRCERNNTACVFEQHRRGRKPGSKLSEASKMLRRLEKGLNVAKSKFKDDKPQSSGSRAPRRRHPSAAPNSPGSSQYSNNEDLSYGVPGSSRYRPDSNTDISDDDGDDDYTDQRGRGMYPARLIKKEDQHHSSYFKTILNSDRATSGSGCASERSYSRGSGHSVDSSAGTMDNPMSDLKDPVALGLIDEQTVQSFFDMFFLRLNPFINMFDPALHSASYVRGRCPFLFTTLIMACCKFFRPELYPTLQTLAQKYAVRAFAEGWTRIEVAQAFASLTFWREPNDVRVWTYIGYACRMAVELGLNRTAVPPPRGESDMQLRERRNRERTYLLLFVFDRSLSMQTGKQWMLPDDELVRGSGSWHEAGGVPLRPEDVTVAANVQMRRTTAAIADMFSHPDMYHSPPDYSETLRNCNEKLDNWSTFWEAEMQKAGGESFHFAYLQFFQLHVRLFLNSFGVNAAIVSSTPTRPCLEALEVCYNSAIESLKIATKFAVMSMLPYSHDSLTMCTAYASVFLVKLLRSPNTAAELKDGAASEIQSAISDIADAYHHASALPLTSASASYHARFLRSLTTKDVFKVRHQRDALPMNQPPKALNNALGTSSGYSSFDASSEPYPQPQPMLPLVRSSHPTLPKYNFDTSTSIRASPLAAAYPSPESDSFTRNPTSTQYGGSAPDATEMCLGTENRALCWHSMLGELGYAEGYAAPQGPPPGVDARQNQYAYRVTPDIQQRHENPYAMHAVGYPQAYGAPRPASAAYQMTSFGNLGH
ncbi:hypothetical protein B0H21DRAFT_550934 [Amylocystis lapponica]|nr:hypothetical protein B0H21DRAFT_550934 [Amylocystis lapponica]